MSKSVVVLELALVEALELIEKFSVYYPINKQSPKAYIHNYAREYDNEDEEYELVVAESKEFTTENNSNYFKDFLKIVRPCEAYINSVLAKMS